MDDRLGPLVMRVFLVRHGEASAPRADGERPLTAAGEADVRRLAQWCVGDDVAPVLIRHSGILRAAQTAEILAATLKPPSGVRAVRGLAPDDDPSYWADALPHETGSVMLVTHMPLVGELAMSLARRRAPVWFGTAEIACFEKDGAGFRLATTWRPAATDG